METTVNQTADMVEPTPERVARLPITIPAREVRYGDAVRIGGQDFTVENASHASYGQVCLDLEGQPFTVHFDSAAEVTAIRTVTRRDVYRALTAVMDERDLPAPDTMRVRDIHKRDGYTVDISALTVADANAWATALGLEPVAAVGKPYRRYPSGWSQRFEIKAWAHDGPTWMGMFNIEIEATDAVPEPVDEAAEVVEAIVADALTTPEPVKHCETGGWSGPNDHGRECACGVSYAGFETAAEATAVMAAHIAHPEPADLITIPAPLVAPAKVEPEKDWYFTFGGSHTHPITGESLGRSYLVLHGTADSTRERMLAVFGTGWSMQYDRADGGRGTAGVKKFGLKRIEFPSVVTP